MLLKHYDRDTISDCAIPIPESSGVRILPIFGMKRLEKWREGAKMSEKREGKVGHTAIEQILCKCCVYQLAGISGSNFWLCAYNSKARLRFATSRHFAIR
jgi:hypothetical protein